MMVIAALEGRDMMTSYYVLNAFIQASLECFDGNNHVIMKIRGILIHILLLLQKDATASQAKQPALKPSLLRFQHET